MIKYFTLFVLMLMSMSTFAQLNADLIAHVDYVAEGKGLGNDIWGYVAPDGTEYAIVGTRSGTLIYSLEDPANPIERLFIPGSNSIWRDMKQWGEYVYVTADSGNDGLLIINMEEAPGNIEFVFRKPELPISSGGSIITERCHNIFIDENGIIYLAGCHGRGVEFFDPNVDPWDPPRIGGIQSPYHHDDYVKGDTLYASRINVGDLAMYDISDKTNPILLGTVNTTSNFTHNAWADPTNTYVFTTDERGNAFVDSYDVSDPSNIEFLDKFFVPGTECTETVPHNTHYFEGYLVTSWYTSGLVVIDGNKPDNMVMIAQYDTFDGPDGDTEGCWGATPYLPSGIVLVNDINTGFYIIDVDYKRAAYLEGMVTDAFTGSPINNVEVIIEDAQYSQDIRSNPIGDYKYGQVEPATLNVTFRHPLYQEITATAELINGEVTILDVEMIEKLVFNLDFTVVDKITGDPLPNAQVEFNSEGIEYNLKTDETGLATGNAVTGVYDIYVGMWGYENVAMKNISLEEAQAITFELEEVYMDDFETDLGWTVEIEDLGNFTGGWERAVPLETSDGSTIYNPGTDVENDLGEKCYVTENAMKASSFSNDVDNGTTTLTSPIMDLTLYSNPTVEYSLWFATGGGQSAPDDAVEVFINNGMEEVQLTSYNNASSTNGWTAPYSIELNDEIDITDNMRLIVRIQDLPGLGNIVEGGFDQFIVRGAPVNITNIEDSNLEIFPNPASSKIQITHDEANISTVEMFNSLGQQVLKKEVNSINTISLDVRSLTTGTYVVSVKLDNATTIVKTVVIKN